MRIDSNIVTDFQQIFEMLVKHEIGYVDYLKSQNKYNDLTVLMNSVPFSSLNNWEIMDKVYDFMEKNYDRFHTIVGVENINDTYDGTPFQLSPHKFRTPPTVLANTVTTDTKQVTFGILMPYYVINGSDYQGLGYYGGYRSS